MVNLKSEERELLERVSWFIRLRWLAIPGVVAITFFSNKILGIKFPVTFIYLVSIVILTYNLIFLLYEKLFIPKITDLFRAKSVVKFANVQIVVDLLAVAVLIHLSGGVENPFIFYFIFHMIIASILLSTRVAFYQATLAIFLFGSICFLEYLEIIPHIHLQNFTEGKPYKNFHYILGTFFVFSSTMYVSVYITTSISRKLRRRHDQILDLKEELEEKNKVLVETQNILIHQEKMSSLGQLSASIAHEINNPLGGILIFASMLLEEEIDQEKKESLKRIVDETIRCRDIVKGLLEFSRIEDMKVELIDIDQPLEDALKLVENMAIFHNIEIFKKIYPNTPKIKGSKKELEQAFLNIIMNAVESMPEGGKIYLRAKKEGDKFVVVEIEDTGSGISPEHLDKIFDPFFSLKDAGKGTGLGLSIVWGIIERHQGEIKVESKINKGTKFIIKLPAERNNIDL